jgi:hypothetical protein
VEQGLPRSHLTLHRWHCLQLIKGDILFCNAISNLLLLLVIITDLCSIYLLVVEGREAYIRSFLGGPETTQRGTRISVVFEKNLDHFYVFAWECRDESCLVVVGGSEWSAGWEVQIFEVSGLDGVSFSSFVLVHS